MILGEGLFYLKVGTNHYILKDINSQLNKTNVFYVILYLYSLKY